MGYRLSGPDNVDTANALAHLGIFQHRFGQSKEGIKSLRRALYVVQLAGGPLNARSSDYYRHLGDIYDEVRHHTMAVGCFREALRFTPLNDVVSTASIMQRLAHSYVSGGQYSLGFDVQVKALRSVRVPSPCLCVCVCGLSLIHI